MGILGPPGGHSFLFELCERKDKTEECGKNWSESGGQTVATTLIGFGGVWVSANRSIKKVRVNTTFLLFALAECRQFQYETGCAAHHPVST